MGLAKSGQQPPKANSIFFYSKFVGSKGKVPEGWRWSEDMEKKLHKRRHLGMQESPSIYWVFLANKEGVRDRDFLQPNATSSHSLARDLVYSLWS